MSEQKIINITTLKVADTWFEQMYTTIDGAKFVKTKHAFVNVIKDGKLYLDVVAMFYKYRNRIWVTIFGCDDKITRAVSYEPGYKFEYHFEADDSPLSNSIWNN